MTYCRGEPIRVEIDLDDPDLLPAERQIIQNIAARTHRQFQRSPLDAKGRRTDELAPDYAPYV